MKKTSNVSTINMALVTILILISFSCVSTKFKGEAGIIIQESRYLYDVFPKDSFVEQKRVEEFLFDDHGRIKAIITENAHQHYKDDFGQKWNHVKKVFEFDENNKLRLIEEYGFNSPKEQELIKKLEIKYKGNKIDSLSIKNALFSQETNYEVTYIDNTVLIKARDTVIQFWYLLDEQKRVKEHKFSFKSEQYQEENLDKVFYQPDTIKIKEITREFETKLVLDENGLIEEAFFYDKGKLSSETIMEYKNGLIDAKIWRGKGGFNRGQVDHIYELVRGRNQIKKSNNTAELLQIINKQILERRYHYFYSTIDFDFLLSLG